MAKAIEQIRNMTVGHAALGFRGGVTGSVGHQVHDGDTINVRAVGNFGVRFLGVDAPEISFTLPGGKRFVGLGDPAWAEYLENPLAAPFDPPLDPGLLAHLGTKVGPGCAANHFRHATEAENALEEEVRKDLEELGQTEDEFRFFLAFAFEVIDRYGRFLCFINREQKEPPRPPSYNERLLQLAKVTPYFIWPNIDPFLEKGGIVDAVIPPGKAPEVADGDPALRAGRQAVRRARQQGLGLYDAHDPLRLLPFEVRFLARRRPPERYVIDLGKADDLILGPQHYYRIPNPEDRLFLPAEYLPLFTAKGWRVA